MIPSSSAAKLERERGATSPTKPTNGIPTPNGAAAAPRRRIRRNTFPILQDSNDDFPPPSRSSSFSAAKTSAEEILLPTTNDSNTWHSIPLAFAVLPAIGAIFFKDGDAFVTDIMLLLLVAVFLHWLVKFPWEWYHASQLVKIAPEDESPASPIGETDAQREAAERELYRNEVLALLFCFLGPCLGGWLLHTVRSQLSRPSEGLVSNFNLTIFVLAAELRPMAQVIELMKCRSVHLQRVVHRPPKSRVDEVVERVEGLNREVKRLGKMLGTAVMRAEEVEALNRMFSLVIYIYDWGACQRCWQSGKLSRGMVDLRAGAVRRYERKDAIQSAQTEARIVELDNQLKDVLTLAAAAGSTQRRETFSGMLVEWISGVVVVPFLMLWKFVSLLARAVEMVIGANANELPLRDNRQRGGESAQGD
jgi:hypothetical protein